MDESLFDSYEQDLAILTASIQSKLSPAEREAASESVTPALLRRIEAEVEEADEIVAQMDLDVQTSEYNKVGRQAKMKGYKGELGRFKADLRALSAASARSELLSLPGSPHVAIDIDRTDSPSSLQAQRTRLLSATDTLTDGQRRLEDSHRVALETEGVGASILRDLRGQRDTLEHTRDNLYEADTTIERASNTLKKMALRMYQQRAVTYAIIVLLVLLIGYLVFYKIF